ETAERQTCVLPLGGIYWDDEIPEFRALMDIPESDRLSILNLFRIRFKIWDGEPPSGEDKVFWDVARNQVPDYPLFRRLELSEDDRAAQEHVERSAEEGFEALFADADEVSVTEENGFQSFSVTFDLTKEVGGSASPKPWWRRVFKR
ncbi:MAG: hypothetical protein AAF492_09480, partial [Verrucomicrobiota bacterium]